MIAQMIFILKVMGLLILILLAAGIILALVLMIISVLVDSLGVGKKNG